MHKVKKTKFKEHLKALDELAPSLRDIDSTTEWFEIFDLLRSTCSRLQEELDVSADTLLGIPPKPFTRF